MIHASNELVVAVKVEQFLSTSYHIREVKGGEWYKKREWYTVNDAKLQGIVSSQGDFKKRLFLCANHTSACMSVRGTTATGTVLAVTENSNFMCLLQR